MYENRNYSKGAFLRAARHWVNNGEIADTGYYERLIGLHDPEAARLYVLACEAHRALAEHFEKHLELDNREARHDA